MSDKQNSDSVSMAQDQAKETEFFDQFTEDKEYDVLGEYGYNVLIKEFKNYVGPERLVKGKKIVDLGCGTGSFTRRFANDLSAECFGIDISENSIKVAREKKDGVNYSVGDIANLDIPDSFFDVVMLSGVIHHFQDFSFCLKEAFRILKKGGCVVSFDPHIKNPGMWLYRDPSSPLCSKLGKTDNEQLLAGKQVEEVLQSEGFTNIQHRAVSGITFKYVESRMAQLVLPLYNTIEYLLGKTFLSKKIGSFLICYGEK